LGYGCESESRIQGFDNNSIPDEIAEIQISPNPFREQFNLSYESGSVDEKVQIRVYNYVGQMVLQEQINVPKNTKYSHPMSVSSLPRGVYVVNVESGGQKQSLKVIKN
jgi:ribosomal protein L2